MNLEKERDELEEKIETLEYEIDDGIVDGDLVFDHLEAMRALLDVINERIAECGDS